MWTKSIMRKRKLNLINVKGLMEIHGGVNFRT